MIKKIALLLLFIISISCITSTYSSSTHDTHNTSISTASACNDFNNTITSLNQEDRPGDSIQIIMDIFANQSPFIDQAKLNPSCQDAIITTILKLKKSNTNHRANQHNQLLIHKVMNHNLWALLINQTTPNNTFAIQLINDYISTIKKDLREWLTKNNQSKKIYSLTPTEYIQIGIVLSENKEILDYGTSRLNIKNEYINKYFPIHDWIDPKTTSEIQHRRKTSNCKKGINLYQNLAKNPVDKILLKNTKAFIRDVCINELTEEHIKLQQNIQHKTKKRINDIFKQSDLRRQDEVKALAKQYSLQPDHDNPKVNVLENTATPVVKEDNVALSDKDKVLRTNSKTTKKGEKEPIKTTASDQQDNKIPNTTITVPPDETKTTSYLKQVEKKVTVKAPKNKVSFEVKEDNTARSANNNSAVTNPQAIEKVEKEFIDTVASAQEDSKTAKTNTTITTASPSTTQTSTHSNECQNINKQLSAFRKKVSAEDLINSNELILEYEQLIKTKNELCEK